MIVHSRHAPPDGLGMPRSVSCWRIVWAAVPLAYNSAIQRTTADVFSAWIVSATTRLTAAGIGDDDARALAFAVVGGLEGAFVLARATRSTERLIASRKEYQSGWTQRSTLSQ